MMKPGEFAGKQRVALEAGDVEEALQLLSELEVRIGAVSAWSWLRSNEPEDYAQLIDKLEQSREGRSASGRTEASQLVGVFELCEACGISLVELDVSNKYREAAAKLNESVAGESEIKKRLDAAIETIKSQSSRAAKRAWARTPRRQQRS